MAMVLDKTIPREKHRGIIFWIFLVTISGRIFIEDSEKRSFYLIFKPMRVLSLSLLVEELVEQSSIFPIFLS
jgi:hypothetical protein